MIISEFADSRDVQSQVISRYIRRHFDEFKGHTKKNGKSVELDDTAIKLLEKKYPLPKPVEVVVDKESQEKLLKAQELIIGLQQQLLEANNKLLEADREKYLLEDRERALNDELERLKGRNLWERIINKD